MHPTFEQLKNELTQVASAVQGAIPNNEPISIAHGNWSFPGVSRDELMWAATSLAALIDAFAKDELHASDKDLSDYVRRLSFLRANTVQQLWSNANQAVSAYLLTLFSLKSLLMRVFDLEKPPAADDAASARRSLRDLQAKIRSIEAVVASTGSRAGDLNQKIALIESAHSAADKLPADLAYLAETTAEVEKLAEESDSETKKISALLEQAEAIHSKLDKRLQEANAIIARCDEAYRSTTSQGLASAFAERANSLNNTVALWVILLMIALSLGAYYGSSHLQGLVATLRSRDVAAHNAFASHEIWLQALLSVFSVAGAVWFGWIATKQIGQRFRLAEDYAYKATISKAYEGYRREAAFLDPAFQTKLFSSALTRLDELPLRLVESETHGSPWHELASSKSIQDAAKSVPGFAERVAELAKDALAATRAASSKASPAAGSAAKAE